MRVELTLKQPRRLLRQMHMRAPATYFSEFSGDGQISIEGDLVDWLPPRNGGTLSWSVALNRLKHEDSYDAYMSNDWALFRASDIIPAAQTRTVKGAASNTSLRFSLPANWSSVTQYYGRNHRFKVKNPSRRFDRPTGWILLGDIGVRAEKVAGVKVKIAAPRNHGVRRADMLALLAWTLPEVTRLFTNFPSRLTIVSANEPMWRGGLSAPLSLYVQSSLPLISENGTSTLLHEIVHTGLGASAEEGADWIIEGLAEYYSLQILLRSGTISRDRFDTALARLADWGNDVTSLCDSDASGPVTAKATVLMHEIDVEIDETTGGKFSLDDVVHVFAQSSQKLSSKDLAAAVTQILQNESDIINRAQSLGCFP